MAELTADGGHVTGARLASQQFASILWLRWRIFANGFRRKGGVGELIGRIVLLPIFAAFALAPTVGAGVLAFQLARTGHFLQISWILWGASGLTQLLNINLGQPGTTFDPIELIRFPMPLSRFVLVRLCFGLLSPANIIVGLISLAVAVGISIARPGLACIAFISMLIFGLTNVLFTRMVFAWIDRWLSTRRAREIFTAFIFIGSLVFQYFNVRYNPGFQHGRHRHDPAANVQPLFTRAHLFQHYTAWLPPYLTADGITSASQRHATTVVADLAACSCFALLFLAVYTLRMRTEFRGENLSDVANATQPTRSGTPRPLPASTATALPVASQPLVASKGAFPSTLAPLLSKELLVLRRNVGLFYGLIAPAVMVFLFAGRMSLRGGSHWVVLAAVAYALLGIAPLSYNSFGLEGTGAQFYFFAPVSLREVLFAKNVFTTLLALVEVSAVVAITTYVAGRPSMWDCVFVVLWAVGTLLLNTSLGNLRSISAPKRVNPGKTMNRAQSPVSAYIAMGILLSSAGLGFGCVLLGGYLHRPWLPSALMLIFALAGAFIYTKGLQGIDAYALERRDTLFEELGKKA